MRRERGDRRSHPKDTADPPHLDALHGQTRRPRRRPALLPRPRLIPPSGKAIIVPVKTEHIPFAEIDKKWQDRWEAEGVFNAPRRRARARSSTAWTCSP